MDEISLSKIHAKSFENKESVNESNKCGCFYCIKIFDAKIVKDWVIDDFGYTALCPYCNIDSVIADNDVEVTEELLNELNKKYF